MALTFVVINEDEEPKRKKHNGHTKAVVPLISLDQPGWLKVCHVMSLLHVGHSTLYQGMQSNRYPKPDGKDGNRPYWHTETIRKFLTEKVKH